MMLREYFYGTPRELQITALKQIESALQQGYNNIVISAPTGVGKSYIAVCLALAFKEGDILTATVQLQEQYLKDFPFVKTIAGRKNFNCPVYERPCSHVPTVRCKGMKRRSTAGSSDDEDDDEGNSSNNGNNSSNSNNNSTYIIPACSLYPTRDDIKRITVLNKGTSKEKVVFNAKYHLCDYYMHKHIAYRASFRIFNYHEYFTLLNNIGSRSKLSTELLICDESHMLEEKVIDFYNVIIDDDLLRPLRKHKLIDIQLIRITEEMNYYKDLLSDIVAGYAELLNIIAEEIAKSEKEEREEKEEKRKLLFKLAEYEERLQRLSTVLDVLNVYPENFIVDIVESESIKQKQHQQKQIVKLLPLNIAPFLKEVFNRIKYKVFMSATIDYPIFKRELGFNDEDTILIDLPSPFPIQNRKVLLMNAYSLNKENMHNEKMLIQIASTIDTIMNKHNKERGLILTTSYELAGNIYRYSNNKHRLLLTKDMAAKEVLEKHGNTAGSVILTPTFWEGVDLRDDLCRFIVIAKTPYPSLADKRVRVKAERDKEWYKSVTLMRLIQGAGRGVRHEKDHCITYILDSNATWLISTKAKQNAVPRWFKDALVYSNNFSVIKQY